MNSSGVRESRRRIAVTGVGLVTPLGLTRDESWQGILAGRTAVRWLEDLCTAPGRTGIGPAFFGAPVPWDVPSPYRMVSFAKRAAREAIEQAGLSREHLQATACVIGTSKIEWPYSKTWIEESAAADHPQNQLEAFSLFPSTPAAAVSQEFNCQSAVICPVAACATGLVSIIQGASLIRSGHCDVAIAGSTDSSLHPGLIASYKRLGVLARPGDDPASACRPFDITRNGFAVGEGAGLLILEDWDHARSRNANILAEWIDGAVTSDTSGLTQVDTTGIALATSIARFLARQKLTVSDISCLSLHGTATRLNDAAESAAMQLLFAAESSPVAAFALKGAIGHLMGAAGAVESAASVLSLYERTIPPTANHSAGDSFLTAVSFQSTSTCMHRPDHLLKVSLGFGGSIALGLLMPAH